MDYSSFDRSFELGARLYQEAAQRQQQQQQEEARAAAAVESQKQSYELQRQNEFALLAEKARQNAILTQQERPAETNERRWNQTSADATQKIAAQRADFAEDLATSPQGNFYYSLARRKAAKAGLAALDETQSKIANLAPDFHRPIEAFPDQLVPKFDMSYRSDDDTADYSDAYKSEVANNAALAQAKLEGVQDRNRKVVAGTPGANGGLSNAAKKQIQRQRFNFIDADNVLSGAMKRHPEETKDLGNGKYSYGSYYDTQGKPRSDWWDAPNKAWETHVIPMLENMQNPEVLADYAREHPEAIARADGSTPWSSDEVAQIAANSIRSMPPEFNGLRSHQDFTTGLNALMKRASNPKSVAAARLLKAFTYGGQAVGGNEVVTAPLPEDPQPAAAPVAAPTTEATTPTEAAP